MDCPAPAVLGCVENVLVGVEEPIEAPWGPRIEKQIRSAMESGEGVIASAAIADPVRRLGLEPFQAPAPLPLLQEEDVRLICWLAVEAA